jgi:hypothetical protein
VSDSGRKGEGVKLLQMGLTKDVVDFSLLIGGDDGCCVWRGEL